MDLSKEIKHGFDFTEVKVVTMVKIDLPQELLQLKKKKKNSIELGSILKTR